MLVVVWAVLGLFDGVIRRVFESLYASAELGLPVSLLRLFGAVRALFYAPLLLGPPLGVALWLARRAGVRLPGAQELAARLAPRLVQRIELDRLFYALHVALSGGLELPAAFALAWRNVRGRRLRKRLGSVHRALERGAR